MAIHFFSGRGLMSVVVLLLAAVPLLGRPVRVRIFSKYQLKTVRLELHGGGWRLNKGPIPQGLYRVTIASRRVRLKGPGGVRELLVARFSKRTSRGYCTVRSGRLKRLYGGQLIIRRRNQRLLLVNRVPEEDYVGAVLFGEVPALAGRRRTLAALKAQAVAIRSYTRYYRKPSHARHGRDGYDFCDLTHCQVYRGVIPSGYRVLFRAVRETKGLLLRYRGKLVPGFYSSTCGGRTVSPGEVWGDDGLDAAFPVREHRLSGMVPCHSSSHFRWRFALDRRVFRDFFSAACFPLLSVQELRLKRGRGGSVRRIVSGNESIAGYHFRNLFCKRWGWNSLRSLDFRMRVEGQRVVFRGEGLGHRIGLCQHGAFAYAAAGWGWRRILKEYYPALQVSR